MRTYLPALARLWRRSSIVVGLLLLPALAAGLKAQGAATGVITGRVYNPTNQEYVANAEVSVQGTANTVLTGDDGSYRLLNVPAGPATVTIAYSGFEAAPATVTVSPGETAHQDFTLALRGAAPKTPNKDDVVQLAAFTVSDERSGNAKLIQQQKASMNVSEMVSTDTFGDIAEGNVGEFLKYLPAIDLDYVEADARNPRVRGLPAQFTTVTFDGMKLSSADGFIQNNGTDNGGGDGAGDRSFGFEQVSMSAIESVEVNYTTNASMDADAPAGNINLIPKHAYERKGEYAAFTIQGMIDSEDAYWRKIRPDATYNSMIRPNSKFEYANSFFNNRLGISIFASQSDTMHEQRQFAPSYDAAPTPTDLRPLVYTNLSFKDGPTITKRPSAGFSIDYKVNDNISVGFSGTWTGYYSWIGNRTFGFATNRANSIATDGYNSWSNVPITGVTSTMQFLNKRTFGHNFLPTVEFKNDRWDIIGKAAASQSINNYAGSGGASFPGLTVGGTSIPTTGMTVSASHPADNNFAWTVVQTGGADVGNLNSWHAAATAAPTVSMDGRYVKKLDNSVALDAKFTTSFKVPTWFKFGGKISEGTWIYRNPGSWQVWSYMGPGGGLGGNWSAFPSQAVFDPGNGAIIRSISGLEPAIPNINLIGATFKQHPEWFAPAFNDSNGAAYNAAFVAQPKDAREQVTAAYAMFDTKPIRAVEIQAGVRFEDTKDSVKNFQALPVSQVQAAGYSVTASNGLATTASGERYQFFTLPRAQLSHEYGKPFPSASVKYLITPDLVWLTGYSYTVTRPSYGDIAGATTVDDDNHVIYFSNNHLKAAYANNYTTRLNYYPRGGGTLGVSVFENDFKNFSQTARLPGSAALYGYTDPLYADYLIQTKVTLPGTVRYRGATAEYTQSLSFLPRPFNGFSIFGNWTRLYTKVLGIAPSTLNAAAPYNYGWLPGVAPNVINYGISYSYRRFHGALNARWQDTEPYSATYNSWERNNTKLDFSASYKLTNSIQLMVSGHNIMDVPDYIYLGNPNRIQPSGARGIEYYGAYWYGGLKFTF